MSFVEIVSVLTFLCSYYEDNNENVRSHNTTVANLKNAKIADLWANLKNTSSILKVHTGDVF